jgi:hypothetical protein
MPVLRIDNYIDDYRLRAQSQDIHDLAGRPNKNATTEFVNRQILAAIELNRVDVLVDIGCGAACLMKIAGGGGRLGMHRNREYSRREGEIRICAAQSALHREYSAKAAFTFQQRIEDRL